MAQEFRQVFVTLSGVDQVGLISAVSATLFDLGANLADTSYTVLGTGYEFSAVCEVPETTSLAEVRAGLTALAELEGDRITVEPFELDALQAENARITHRIKVSGGDRPGLIARLSEVFLDYNANVVRMTSVRTPLGNDQWDYVTRFGVNILAERSDSCLAAINNTAQQLSLNCTWEAV